MKVHARMPGLLRGGNGSMDQRWQELASWLSVQQPQHDAAGGPLPPSFTHPFGPHPHPGLHPHHPHGPVSSAGLHHPHHHPAMHPHHHHHPAFSSASGGPPVTPYHSSSDSARNVLLQNATLSSPPDLNPSAGSVYGSVGMGKFVYHPFIQNQRLIRQRTR
jgi:hypothetical protein